MPSDRRTKIICTYGPAIASKEMVSQMVDLGMNIMRFNLSHGQHDFHLQGMNYVKEVRDQKQLPIAIMMDTSGPEIRTADSQDPEFLELKTGQIITISSDSGISTTQRLLIDFADFSNFLQTGNRIFIDDGQIAVEVIEKEGRDLKCSIVRGGTIKPRRGVNTPGISMGMTFLTDKDKKDLAFAAEQGVDIVAASFTRGREDIKKMRNYLFAQDRFTCDIVAKIENYEGVKNISEICQVADGIMIARGDLGVELPVEEVPRIQKDIIRLCRTLGKPSIIATQMLVSMMENLRPTRAEVSDVANAVYDSTSAIMLSGETAAGKHPLECVAMMDTIARQSEKDFPDVRLVDTETTIDGAIEMTKSMAAAALVTAKSLGASAIITLTSSGYSTRMVSRLRPTMALLGVTENKRIFYRMAIYWGVTPCFMEETCENLGELFSKTLEHIKEKNLLTIGDLVVMLGGAPIGVAGSTNVLRISSIGNVAVRGRGLVSKKAQGQVHIFKNRKTTPDGKVLVMRYLLEEDLEILSRAKGLILQSNRGDEMARSAGESLGIPVISEVEGAYSVLRQNEIISIEGDVGLVFRVLTEES